MDLLKDITRELRGDESARDDGSAGRARRTDAVDSSTTDSDGEFSADDDSPSDDSPSNDRARDSGEDIHVCSFCETEFDADRRACPECDAELVLRGER